MKGINSDQNMKQFQVFHEAKEIITRTLPVKPRKKHTTWLGN